MVYSACNIQEVHRGGRQDQTNLQKRQHPQPNDAPRAIR